MTKTTSGFTIVELLVVIIIIGILATLSVTSFGRYQTDTRDSQRSAKSTILVEALEKYYDANGEYPSCAVMSGSAATITSTILPGLDPAALVTPKSAAGVTNSIQCADLTGANGEPDAYAYVGDATGWTLKYRNETTNTIKTTSSRRSVPGPAIAWAKIAAGDKHTCAISVVGIAYCWGNNTYGQLGNGTTTNSSKPVAVNTSGVLSGKTVTSIVSSVGGTCVIASDGLAYCWGQNTTGELGNNSTTTSAVPVAVSMTGALAGKTVTSIAASIYNNYGHACLVASDGLAYCWGDNRGGDLGINSTTPSLIPVAVNTSGVLSGKTILAVTVSDMYGAGGNTCVIASDNKAYCWGSNFYGTAGDGTGGTWDISRNRWVPVAVDTSGALAGKTVTSISASGIFVSIIASDGKPYTWGGFYGPDSPLAVNPGGALAGKTLTSVTGFSNGAGTYYGVSAGQAYVWNVDNTSVPAATAVSGLIGKSVTRISTGGTHVCVVTSDANAYCRGYNDFGQLGDGTATHNADAYGAVFPDFRQVVSP